MTILIISKRFSSLRQKAVSAAEGALTAFCCNELKRFGIIRIVMSDPNRLTTSWRDIELSDNLASATSHIELHIFWPQDSSPSF